MARKIGGLAGLGLLVYSTETGRHCPNCAQPRGDCTCRAAGSSGISGLPPGDRAAGKGSDGVARVRRESKGRGGKTVTTVAGIVPGEALKELAGVLKRRCGTGGTLKDGVIEIQGEHVDLLLDELGKRGFKAKRSGG